MKNDPLLMEIQDEISRENMVRFANQYSKWIITAAILFFVGIAAFQFWQQYSVAEATKTGDQVYSVLANTDKHPDEFSLKALDSASHTRGYYEIALLNRAAIQVKNSDFPGAIASYDAVAKNGSNKPLRDLAALNAANLLLNSNPKADGLEKRLTDINNDNNSYKYSARELLAAYYIQNNNNAKATDILSQLAKDPSTPVTIAKRARELAASISTKIDDAGDNEED